MSDTEPDVPERAAPGAALAAPADECPISAVFSDGQYPCTLWRGHDGKHEFTEEPHPWPDEQARE